MRSVLAVFVLLAALLAAFLYLRGNPLDTLQQAPIAAGDPLPAAPAAPQPEPVPVLATAGGEVMDATPPAVPPAVAPADAPSDAPTLAPASDTAQVEQEARTFISDLTEPAPEPLAVSEADHFVRSDQVLSMLPETAVETTTLEALKQAPGIAADTPITVVRTVEQVEAVTPERVIADSGGNLEQVVRVLGEGDDVEEVTVREVLERHRAEPSRPIMMVRKVEHYEVTTTAELEREQAASGTSTPLRVIRQPHVIARATITELLESRNEKVEADSIFYLRTVREGDRDGIWGIVRDGIAENFGRGVALRRGEEVDTFRIDIPRGSDQVQSDRSSSFLGRIIYDKTQESHVYNYRLNRMGQNPDRIFPGQELVIIQFRSRELVSIYRHFVERAG